MSVWRVLPSRRLLSRLASTPPPRPSSSGPHVAVVGAGPAGFYLTQHLLSKGPPGLEVDILERLPVPYGLVRFGVAPDHPEVKNVENTFARVVSKSAGRARFFGNVRVGGDSGGLVGVRRLREMYDAVVLSYGAEEDKELGIPGEDLRNVLSARSFVDLYNGLPGADSDLDLSSCGEAAAVLGVGNVALDVARILLTPVDELRKTDITEEALEQLGKSSIRRVYIIGRRGPLQVSFTIKELREMVNLQGCVPRFNPDDFVGVKEIVPQLKRPRKRLTELLAKTALDPPTEKQIAARKGATRSWDLKLLRTPIEVLGDENSAVSGIKVGINRLVGDELSESQGVEDTGETETLECGLVLRSIGYRSVRCDADVPFDDDRGVVPNVDGRVEDGLYCTGWVATGPRGVIVDTMTGAQSVAETVLQDLTANRGGKPGRRALIQALEESRCEYVDWDGWGKIDAEEVKVGKRKGKPREKMTSVKAMLEAARS